MGPFVQALKQLDLSDAQRVELKELKQSMRESMKGKAGRGELNKSLATAIESGNVTVAAFSRDLDQIESSAQQRVTSMRDALNKLHATLTAEQRSELVSRMSERMAESKQGKRGKRGKAGKPMGKLAKKLDLTDEQLEQLKSLDRPEMPEPRADVREQMKTAMEAFETDSFDAAALDVGANMPAMARAKAEHMIAGLEQLVPLLDDGQRAELAKLVETRGKRAKGKRGKRAQR
jgi:Spy/CpxP family protein refolding chaperone